MWDLCSDPTGSPPSARNRPRSDSCVQETSIIPGCVLTPAQPHPRERFVVPGFAPDCGVWSSTQLTVPSFCSLFSCCHEEVLGVKAYIKVPFFDRNILGRRSCVQKSPLCPFHFLLQPSHLKLDALHHTGWVGQDEKAGKTETELAVGVELAAVRIDPRTLDSVVNAEPLTDGHRPGSTGQCEAMVPHPVSAPAQPRALDAVAVGICHRI